MNKINQQKLIKKNTNKIKNQTYLSLIRKPMTLDNKRYTFLKTPFIEKFKYKMIYVIL